MAYCLGDACRLLLCRKVHKRADDRCASYHFHPDPVRTQLSFSPFFLERRAYPSVHDLILNDSPSILRLEFTLYDTRYTYPPMDIHSSTQIAKFNQVFGPNPFNTGPPIPPPLLATLFEIEREVLDSERSTPDLSSSPTSTAPSSPQSSRSALSLDDPEIRKIWGDPRFGPVVHNGTPPELNSFTSAYPFEEEVYTLLDTPPFLKEGSLGNTFTQAGTLNPLAQPFVPCFIVQDIQHSIGMDQISTFYDDSALLTPLNFGDGDRQYGPPDSSTYLRNIDDCAVRAPSHSAAQFDSPSVLDPLYPPGLPLPRNFGKLRGTPEYSSILVEALLPTHDNLTRNALLQPIFDQIEVWDLFTLRELTSALMAAAFGDEHDLVLPCSGEACPNHGDENIEIERSVVRDAITLPEEVFFQVVASFVKMIFQNSGQSFVDMFLMQVIDSIFSRFISYFDSVSDDTFPRTTCLTKVLVEQTGFPQRIL